MVDEQGIRADPKKISAIVEMKAPTNISALRRFMGMTNQLGKFSQKLAELTQPLRQLLSKRSAWIWGPDQERAFNNIKTELTKPTILAMYDPSAPTKVSADASSHGLGAVILQQQESGWKPIAYASRSMTETEIRYAQIEKEALATTWACEKFSTYILGMKFSIETDHKPLVPLLGSKNLDRLPPRILRFRLRLARFDYTISHVPGKLLYTADALSRAPSTDQDNDMELQQDVDHVIETCVLNLPISREGLQRYLKAQEEDQICQSIKRYCKEGWPERKHIDDSVIPFWNTRGSISMDNDGLLLYGQRIIVPTSLRKEALQRIHNGHQGIQHSQLRAKISVWWPGISTDIDNTVKQCPSCAKNLSPRKEPMIIMDIPDYPWQTVAADLFNLNGENYLVIVDYFSRYPEIFKLTSTTSQKIIGCLKSVFSRLGIPEVFISDNGPQFASQDFANFAKDYTFQHVTSSPHFAQSNGLAERTVQTVKRLLRESGDPNMAMLTYRSTPFPWCKLSPAELLMGRRLRGNMPLTRKQLIPEWTYMEDFKLQNKRFKERQKKNYDHRHRVCNIPPLPDNTKVWITSSDQPTPGVIVRAANTPRSYIVNTPAGQVRRNRYHLNRKPVTEESSTDNRSVLENPSSTDDGPSEERDPIMTRTRSGTSIHPPNRL